MVFEVALVVDGEDLDVFVIFIGAGGFVGAGGCGG